MDERADVFALGSIFCELLTGEPAFTGRNSGEIQRKAARGDLADTFGPTRRQSRARFGVDRPRESVPCPERDDRPAMPEKSPSG